MDTPVQRKMNLQLFAEEESTETVEQSEPSIMEKFGLEETEGIPPEVEVEEPEAKPAEEEEFDEIVYNQESVKIPKSERQTYLQKGYNYDKVNGKLSEREQSIKQIESLAGMNLSDIINHLQSQAQQEQVTQYAEETGVPTEVAQRILENEQKVQSLEQRDQAREHEATILKQKEELKNKPFFKDLEQEIDGLTATGSIDANIAYNYLLGQKFEELTAKERQLTEKRTIANIADRGKRAVETDLTDKTPEQVLTANEIKYAHAFGLNPKDVAKTKLGNRR